MENAINIADHTWSDGGTTDVAEPSDPDAASLAVGVVVEGARKGVVALCASVAHIIRERNKLEKRVKDLERQISVGNSTKTNSPLSCTVMKQVSSSLKSRSLPESPSALRQRCGSAPPTYIENNLPFTTGNMGMRLPHTERKTYSRNSIVKNGRNCVCNEIKTVNDLENHECSITEKHCQKYMSYSKDERNRKGKPHKTNSKRNIMNLKNCEIEHSNKDIKLCSTKNVQSSPGSDTSYECNLAINGHNAELRASQSYSGSQRTSPQLLLTPDYRNDKNHNSFQRDSKNWSTRSLNVGVNLPRGSFMRRKYSTISLRRVKKNVSSKERNCSSSGGGTTTSGSSSSRGSSFDLGSRRSSDHVNAGSSRRGSQFGMYPSQQQQHNKCMNCSHRSSGSGSSSSRSCNVTVAEVHHEPESTNQNNTEREAVKILARTLTTILQEQNEAQELSEISSPSSNYMHNTRYDSPLNDSKESSTSTSLCTSKMSLSLNKNNSIVTNPISEFDDTVNQDCDITFDVPSMQAASPLPMVSESFQCSPGSQSRVSENFESSSSQDTVDATENVSVCNQEIQAPFPLAGCECPICERLSTNASEKLFALTTDDGFLLPAGSAVLVEGDRVGTVLYMGHQRTTVAAMLSDHSVSAGSCCYSHINSAGQLLEFCDHCGFTDTTVHFFTTQLAPIGVMVSLWNAENQETFVPLSAVICQLDEDSLINSNSSTSNIKSNHLTLSQYEDVESDEDTFYRSYGHTNSTLHSLSNEENNFNGNGDDYSMGSEVSGILAEEEENIEEMTEEENEDNRGKLLVTTSNGHCDNWIKSEVYPSQVKQTSQGSFHICKEQEQVLDDTTSIDQLSLYGLDYQDDDPDFTNPIESDIILNEEFCSHNSVSDPGFHEYNDENYLITSPTDLRKMSNSFRVTISPSTDHSESPSNRTFDYPHSTELNTTYLKEQTDDFIFADGSTEEKNYSFTNTDENVEIIKGIKENTMFTKIPQHSLYDTCDSAISLSFVRKFSERNEHGTSEISRSSSILESGRGSASLGDTWGSSNLSYPHCRSDSSGNVSDVEMNHLSTTFTKDLASALNSVLKNRQEVILDRETSTVYEQENKEERSFNNNGGSPYNRIIVKSEMSQGPCARTTLKNIYQEDSEV